MKNFVASTSLSFRPDSKACTNKLYIYSDNEHSILYIYSIRIILLVNHESGL